MNQENKTTETPEPKDALEFRFERAIKRALLSPIIKDGEPVTNFVDRYDQPPYEIAVGLIVKFVDSETYGSYYPFWFLQIAFIKKDKPSPRPVKWKLIPKRRVDSAIDLANRIVTLFGRAKEAQAVTMGKDAYNFDWQVPFTETEIASLNEVFQTLVRRKK